ncbi:hypothetical protein Tco_0721035 [Tanacetum coccineum]
MVKTGLVEAIDSLVPLDKRFATFRDDIVLVAKSAEGLNNRLESWRDLLEDNGVRGGSGGIENAKVDLWLRWFGHVKRRPQSAPVRRVEALLVDGLSRRGRPKLRWEDKVKKDMKDLLLSEDMTSDRNA